MVSIDYDISLTVDFEDWERTAFRWLAGLLIVGGLIAGGLHLVAPQPILPYIAAVGLIVGFGLTMAFGEEVDDGTDGFDDAPLTAKAGYLSATVGVAVLAIGVTTPQPFTEVAAGGFTLLIVGVIVTGYFDPDVTMEQESNPNPVPDDPTEMLSDESEEEGEDQ